MLHSRVILFVLLSLMLSGTGGTSADVQDDASSSVPTRRGAFQSAIYRNFFAEILEQDSTAIDARLERAWQQLFHGDDQRERIYFPVAPDMAYIEDIGSGDVRSEGMSYGMMIAVQMDKKEAFDRLWKWATTYMYHAAGPRRGYFAWHCKPDGTRLDPNSASDGEEWMATALFFAAGRWGNGDGIFDYQQHAQALLDTMLHKGEEAQDVVTSMFDPVHRQVVFVPEPGIASSFTDPSYHLPHFYELWARWAEADRDVWTEVARTSRRFLRTAAHRETGLMPDYAAFDGSPVDPWDGGHDDFRFDAWRVGMNIAIDHQWFAADPWQVEQSDRLLAFFAGEGLDTYVNQYGLDGTPLSEDRSLGLQATNAVAATASTLEEVPQFLAALWNAEIPTGQWRYYDGVLYMLAMLQVSGNFRIYPPPGR